MNFKKTKKIILNLLIFDSPQAITFNLTIILTFLTIIPTKILENGKYSICIFKNHLLPLLFQNNCPTAGIFANCECPACGLTRAISHLLHGNIHSAIAHNKLAIPILIIILIVLIINLIKSINHYKKTNRILPD